MSQSQQVDFELSRSHAEVLEVLGSGPESSPGSPGSSPESGPEIVDLTKDAIDSMALQIAQVDAGLPVGVMAQMKGVVRSINDVLGPKHFASDWRLKWEKKCAAVKKYAGVQKASGSNRGGGPAYHREVNKKRVFVEAAKADPNWKIGNKFPRQKGAAMTDFAM